MKKTLSFFFLAVSFFILCACSPVTPVAPISLELTTTPAIVPSQTPANTQPLTMPCLVTHAPVTPAAMGAEFEDRGHVSGPAGAAVTIVVFSDYQCATCAFLEANLKQIRMTHPDDVRIVFVTTPHNNTG